jgi:Protein of unknown function (DUF3093)
MPGSARAYAGRMAWPRTTSTQRDLPVRFDERLRTPWWWYIVALFVASLLAGEFGVADKALTVWLPFGVLLPGSVVIVWSMGRNRVSVVGDELHVNEAHLPLAVIAGGVPLDATSLRRLVGRYGDPASYVAIRAWVGPGIQIILDDPEDPTPYWVISTRRPEELLAALGCLPAPG